MASLGREIGLRLLLSPSASSLLVRAASVGFGLGFPVYLSFKAIEKKSQEEQEQWLVYWAVYGCFTLLEKALDKLISWLPFYHHAKLAFLFWLQLPNNYGVRYLFYKYMRPFLLQHRNRLDRIVEGTHIEMNKFMTTHHEEIQAVGQVVQRAAVSAYKAADQTIRSTCSLYAGEELDGNANDH